MGSGIGPRDELKAFGIKSVTDLPGVGRNLIDHLHVPVVAIPTPGVPHDPLVMNPIGIRYTASGSAEFNGHAHVYLQLLHPWLLTSRSSSISPRRLSIPI